MCIRDRYGNVFLQTKQLEIGAARINGFDNNGLSAQISADTITLRNPGFNSDRIGTGTGALTLNAKNIILSEGNYAISGFSTAALNATDAIKGRGLTQDAQTGNSSLAEPGLLTVAGDLNLNAAYFIGDPGATTRIDASGHQININRLDGNTSREPAGLGAAWSMTANALSLIHISEPTRPY